MRLALKVHLKLCSKTAFSPLSSLLQGAGVKSIIIPGIVGVILGLALGMAIFYT